MSIQTVLFPLFVEVVLTLVLGFWLSALRVDAVRSARLGKDRTAVKTSEV